MAYVCQSINESTNLCDVWVHTMTLADFAITGTQATEICLAIASFYSICWVLKKSRWAVK